MINGDLHGELANSFVHSADLVPSLEVLAERNYIRLAPGVKRTEGGRPSTTYEVNPALLQGGREK